MSTPVTMATREVSAFYSEFRFLSTEIFIQFLFHPTSQQRIIFLNVNNFLQDWTRK